MAQSLQLQLVEEEDEDLEEIFVNGKTACVHKNLPSKSKLSQWCQKNNIKTPIYEVRGFHLGSLENVFHLARIVVEGEECLGRGKSKRQAETSAAQLYLNGIYLTEKNSFLSGFKAEWERGKQVKSTKKIVTRPSLKLKQIARLEAFNARKKKLEEESSDPVPVPLPSNTDSKAESETAAADTTGPENYEENIVFFDLEMAGGPDDTEIIQIAFANCKKAVKIFVWPEGGIDRIGSKISHNIRKQEGKLIKKGKTLNFVTMKEAGENFLCFLRQLRSPTLVCHGNDWVTLLNNLAKVELDEDVVKVLKGVVDFKQIVSNHELLMKGSLSLLKLSSVPNLTETILKGEISRDEMINKGHDASFDTDVLLRVFFRYVNSFENDPQGMWKTYLQPSENLIQRAAMIIRHIGEKRKRKKKVNSVEFEMFNGWNSK